MSMKLAPRPKAAVAAALAAIAAQAGAVDSVAADSAGEPHLNRESCKSRPWPALCFWYGERQRRKQCKMDYSGAGLLVGSWPPSTAFHWTTFRNTSLHTSPFCRLRHERISVCRSGVGLSHPVARLVAAIFSRNGVPDLRNLLRLSRLSVSEFRERAALPPFPFLWAGFQSSQIKTRGEIMSLYSVAERVIRMPSAQLNFSAKLEQEFDRLSGLIASGQNQFEGFTPDELATLTAINEEKRREFLAGTVAGVWTQYWQSPGRLRSVLRSDPRGRAIYQTRLTRNSKPDSPVRYSGFSDDGRHRTFRFSALPRIDCADDCHICVPLSFFWPDGLLLQEGPAFSAAILTKRGKLSYYTATLVDVEQFLSRRTSSRKSAAPSASRFRAGAELIRHATATNVGL